jgi:hypothetical protein
MATHANIVVILKSGEDALLRTAQEKVDAEDKHDD